jgi:hypothetical protein
VFSQAELDAIATRLNSRPRKTLGFATPDEHYFGSSEVPKRFDDCCLSRGLKWTGGDHAGAVRVGEGP